MKGSALLHLCAFAHSSASTDTAPGRSIVTVVPIERRCPDPKFQFLPDRDICRFTDRTELNLTCRGGGKLKGTQCYKEEIFGSEKICPKGSLFNGNECEEIRKATVKMTCENGDELINGECLHVDGHPVKPSCPKGYQLAMDGSRCEAATFTTAEFVCPADFLPSVQTDRLCERLEIKEVVSQCPPGTFVHNNMCLSTLLEGQASKKCASGGERDAQGRCVSVTQVEPDIVCADGYAFTSGRCEKPSFAQPKYRCPRDYVLQGDTCVHTVAAEAYCSGETKMTALGTCVGIEHRDAARVCPQRSVPGAEGRCVVQVVYENDLQLSCGDRYALVEGRCMKKIKTTDAVVCPQGFLLNQFSNICELREIVPSEPRCVADGIFDVAKQSCISLVSTDAMISCPRGTDYNRSNSQCQAKRTYTPTYSCPEGMQLKKTGPSARPSIIECIKRSTVPAQTSCSGLGDLTSKGQCTRTIIQSPERHCPAGYNMDEGQCVRTEETNILRTCPDGFKHVGNACVGKVPAFEGESRLSSDDRLALQEVLGGMTFNTKRAPSFRKAVTDKNQDAALLGLLELAKAPTANRGVPLPLHENKQSTQKFKQI